MSLNIKIENFEGPFDLLLHLIKKNEMDIYNIRIYEITTQYLKYLNSMKELDLEVTSEFIVIAATLLEIKSKMLLPKQETEENEDDDEDPRKELINKLLEYKKFKQIANFLKQREENMGFMYSKKPEIIEDIPKDNNNDILKGLTILKLFNVYN
ncbi:segregation/condensation protein A, partial [Clostridium botulinum C/D]